MNDDDEFEHKLRDLTAQLARPDPTAAWKPDILSRARAAREKGTPRSPRWFLTALGAAWLLIAVLRFTTPEGLSVPGVRHRDAEASTSVVLAQDVSSLRHLLAMHHNTELLDLP